MANQAKANPWIAPIAPNPHAGMRLFCFPYAGAGAVIFKDWHKSFPREIEVCPVQLPGRGGRLRERPFTQIKPLVAAAAEALRPLFDKPFAFFGHSMGALISYELAQVLREQGSGTPLTLFVGAHSAPHLRNREAITYNLPDNEFLAELRRLKGTPQEVLGHPELMELMAPLLRADFEVCETYPVSTAPPLESTIIAFGGVGDVEVPREKMEAWRQHTTGRFALHMLAGDHFFIQTSQTDIIRIVVGEMRALMMSGKA
ncbi:MAG TPA: alpha/beta fold hydrolase [Pyrinomonadaceae bacterium]|nr:alpha/beta fold hydrolase [Pyrinomonadaceae bacterium]